MKNKPFTICSATIQPGEKSTLALPLPERYSCAPMYMPIKVIQGVSAGPVFLVFSVINGHELNGLETINRLVDSLDPKDLSGTVIAVPVLNVFAFTHNPMGMPQGGRLCDSFPGLENGRYNERIAYIFTEELLKKADYCLELQTGALHHDILPQIYCNFDNAKSKALAKVFQAPVVTNVQLRENSIRSTTENLQIPLLVYEAGEAMRFNESAISVALQGIQNLMVELEMLEIEQEEQTVEPMFSKDEDWLASPASGIMHAKVTLGQVVHKGDLVCLIADPFAPDRVTAVHSPQAGVLVGVSNAPLVQEGLSIFKIASFLDNDKAEAVIGDWEEQQPEAT